MSYCYTNLKSFILRFKCQENIDEKDYNKNKFLMHINPERQLFFLCIGINDYTSVDKKGREEEGNLSLNGSQKESNEDNFAQQLSSKTISSTSSNKSVDAIISQRVFCITSYYPFFTFYEEILRNLINIVKMERLMIYKHNNEDIKASDS